MFHWINWIAEFSDKKLFIITVKGLEPATCVRDQDAIIAPAGHMWRDRILKLTPIHAAVINQIPWIQWKFWSI